jgi:hypothetical protein
MLAGIKSYTVLDNYKVELLFTDGAKGIVDFSSKVGKGVFADWNNYENFRKVSITHKGRVLEWEGERDFCADSLYMKATNTTPEEYASDK